MRRKLIHFKPGPITLYDRNAGDFFWGRLLVNFKKSFDQTTQNLRGRDEIIIQTITDSLNQSLVNIKHTAISSQKKALKQKPKLLLYEVSPKPKPEVNQDKKDQPNPPKTDLAPKLIDFKYFYLRVIKGFLFPKLKQLSESYKNKLDLEVITKPKLNLNINYRFFSRIGFAITLVSFSLLLSYFLMSQTNLSSLAFFNTKNAAPSPLAEVQKPPQFEPTPDPTPASREFRITISKIDLSSDITPNVDLADEKVYKQKLLHETGVAHALGSYFPGENGPIYLFAHSTDTLANIPLFNAKFYSLQNLELEDEIEIAYHGKNYKYAIKSKQIIKPEDISIIQSTNYKLILQTCWPPGTDWQRLIIFADPVDNPPEN